MKAISLWQPWATLIADEEKRWETRGRRIHHRGWIAIHAAKKREPMIAVRRQYPFWARLAAHDHDLDKDLPLGVIVAIGRITDCISTTEWLRKYCKTPQKPGDDHEYTFGNYEPGRFAWKIEDVRRLREPLPMKGHQSLWTLTAAEEAQVFERIGPTDAEVRHAIREYELFRDGSGPS